MADFEREAFLNLIIRDIKNQIENEKTKARSAPQRR
jgi:hypothetical protein